MLRQRLQELPVRIASPSNAEGAAVSPRRKRVLLSWICGKDPARTRHVLRQSPEYEVTGLLTTINAVFGRVAMHAVRRELAEARAGAAWFAFYTTFIYRWNTIARG